MMYLDDVDDGFAEEDYFVKPGGSGVYPYFNKLKKCSDTHKIVAINCKDGKTYQVQGGSCSDPGGDNNLSKVDVFVGFDPSMVNSDLGYPWESGTAFLFEIRDMCAPKDITAFNKLLEYLSTEVLAGKSVFLGCIGGHGRTGLVLAALITYMTGDLDSVSYLRKVYCKKAVETQDQVDFLYDNYKIHKCTPVHNFGVVYKGVSSGSKTSGVQGIGISTISPVEKAFAIFTGCLV